MKIWIVNFYCTPPEYDHYGRHIAFARHLQAQGHDVSIIMSGTQGTKDYVDDYFGEKYRFIRKGDLDFIIIKSAHYVGNGLKRCFSIFQFAMRVFFNRKRFPRPDIILHNIHEPFDYPISWCAKRLKAKYIVEDWDLWTRSFITMGFLKKAGLLAKMIKSISGNLFAKADRIIFSVEGGKEYVKDMGWDKDSGGKVDLSIIYYINNGVDLKEFERCVKEELLDDFDLKDDGFVKVVYLGAINLANNLKPLINAARLLLNKPKIRFLIYGDGINRMELEKYCQEEKITNVIFKQKEIPFSSVPYVLSRCDINILHYNQSVGHYGLSSGKLFMYLASGKPICSNLDLRDYDIITKNKLGISKPFKTDKDYANAIQSLTDLPKSEYDDMCKRVKQVSTQFDYDVLSQRLIDIINEL